MTGPVVVIGAGLAGLGASIHLAAAGRDVTVVEASDGPGGCCGTASVGPYRFDTGPSVLTMPGVIEETVGAAGEELASWLPLTELDPYYRLAFHDGSHLDVLPGADRMAAEVNRLSGAREAERYLRFRRQLELLLEAEWEPFVARDFQHLSDLVQVRAMIRLARLGALRRMSSLAERYLTDWRLIRAHTFQALYVGLDPARAPGIYSIVSTMDTIGGVHIPARGGMHAVPLALADVAAKAGAQLRYGTPAERVLTGASGVTGVRLAGGELLPASSVIVATDLPAAHRDLLPPGAADWRLLRPHFAPSCPGRPLRAGSPAARAGTPHTAPRGGLGGHLRRADPARRCPARPGPQPAGDLAGPRPGRGPGGPRHAERAGADGEPARRA